MLVCWNVLYHRIYLFLGFLTKLRCKDALVLRDTYWHEWNRVLFMRQPYNWGFRVWGLGFRVWGFGFGVWGLRFTLLVLHGV